MTKKKYYVKKSENQKEYLILDKKDNHCVCVLDIEQINQGIKDWINDFEKRIQKNEDYLVKEHKKKIKWAVEQLDHTIKDDDQRKAWSIILKELGIKKTSLRCKPVKNG